MMRNLREGLQFAAHKFRFACLCRSIGGKAPAAVESRLRDMSLVLCTDADQLFVS